MDVAITGSSGLIGSALVAELTARGHRPIAVVRADPKPGSDQIRWDPEGGQVDTLSLEGLDAVVNLAGAPIGAKRWTNAYKDLLVRSRVQGTALLAGALTHLDKPPSTLLNGSAIGYYGDCGAEAITEQAPGGDTFLAQLVQKWESATASAADAGIRVAFLRTGIVLSAAGGALAKLLPLFRMGVGGRLGPGTQYMSWISITDEVNAIIHLLQSDVRGPVNLTAPSPVTNAEFASVLGSTLGRPAKLPVPAFGPRLLLGRELADALLFESARVQPAVLTADAYQFDHPDLTSALQAVTLP